MAKRKDEFKINNAMIDLAENKLIETTKDGLLVYNLQDTLKEWDKRDGLSITIFQNVDIEPDSTEY